MSSIKELYNTLLKNEPSIHQASTIELAKIHDVELETMKDLIRVCDKHNLNLLLGGGSCLGAVRHGGFIPWDDDMDFNMPRSDFEKFKLIFESELGDKYILHAPNYNKVTTDCRFAKVERKDTLLITHKSTDICRGICVDIFPIENIPKNRVVRRLKGILAECIMFAAGQVWFAKSSDDLLKSAMSKSIVGRIRCTTKIMFGTVLGLYPMNRWFDLVDRVNRYNGKTILMGVPTGRKHYFGEYFESTVYLPKKEVVFEGEKAYLPNNEDSYLSNLYGDYMKIPTEEKKEHHYIYGLVIDGNRIDG